MSIQWLDRVNNARFLVTGGSGFLGDYFIGQLLACGAHIVNVDIVASERQHENLRNLIVDIRDHSKLEEVFSEFKFDAVFHFAALLAHGDISVQEMRDTNVAGTGHVVQLCKKYTVPRLVFTSTNCLWGGAVPHAITEADEPSPCEEYGISKWDAEKVILQEKELVSAIIRTPTIIQAGRLGLLAILFEFIEENRKVWVVGDGHNRYQFVAAIDLVQACVKALDVTETEIFNVGSDDVPTIRDTYQYVMDQAGSSSRVACLPKWVAIPAMKIAHFLHISPLGPYHWRMIAESFSFNTSKIKQKLGWSPTLNNKEILLDAYHYFAQNKKEISLRSMASAHRKATPMGAIKLLKWIS